MSGNKAVLELACCLLPRATAPLFSMFLRYFLGGIVSLVFGAVRAGLGYTLQVSCLSRVYTRV